MRRRRVGWLGSLALITACGPGGETATAQRPVERPAGVPALPADWARQPPASDSVAQWEGPLFNRELPAEIRVWVVTQLALEPVPEATAVLVRALAEPEVRVVRAVVAALDQRGDSAARPALERLRAHPDPQISRQVGKVLEKL